MTDFQAKEMNSSLKRIAKAFEKNATMLEQEVEYLKDDEDDCDYDYDDDEITGQESLFGEK